MNRSILFFVALGVTSFRSLEAAAAAPDPGYYLDADAGINFERGTVRLTPGPDVLNKVPDNQHDGIWGFSLGEQFTRHFALELGYRDLGRVSGALVNAPGANPATGSFRFSASGPTLAMVWRVPFGRWEADFKLGSLFADAHLSMQVTDRLGGFAVHESAWNPGLLVEAGVGYRLTDHWTVSLSKASFSNIGRRDTTGRWNVQAVMLGASYHF
jgi:opacity protein-like surface antigen